jgi:hypothetical protein
LKDKCSYCDKDGHNARDCYKRQNDENKSKGNPKLTQANLNIEVDEHAFMFSNAVLSISLSEHPLTQTHEDISHWGETKMMIKQREMKETQTTKSKKETILEKSMRHTRKIPGITHRRFKIRNKWRQKSKHLSTIKSLQIKPLLLTKRNESIRELKASKKNTMMTYR